MNARRLLSVSLLALLAEVAHAVDSSPLPMDSYTVGAVIQVLMIGVVVAVLLIGGILLLNLGLMSKRPEDRVGGRTPSDVGILKGTNWPEEQASRARLPAEETEGEGIHFPRIGLAAKLRRKKSGRAA